MTVLGVSVPGCPFRGAAARTLRKNTNVRSVRKTSGTLLGISRLRGQTICQCAVLFQCAESVPENIGPHTEIWVFGVGGKVRTLGYAGRRSVCWGLRYYRSAAKRHYEHSGIRTGRSRIQLTEAVGDPVCLDFFKKGIVWMGPIPADQDEGVFSERSRRRLKASCLTI
jgi:hypothetical protein